METSLGGIWMSQPESTVYTKEIFICTPMERAGITSNLRVINLAQRDRRPAKSVCKDRGCYYILPCINLNDSDFKPQVKPGTLMM